MGMDSALVCCSLHSREEGCANDGCSPGWYDSVYDEELGSQPCIFTSVTPVSPDAYFLPPLPAH